MSEHVRPVKKNHKQETLIQDPEISTMAMKTEMKK